MTPSVKVLSGDALQQLLTLPDESVHCAITSPPYWGLRSYLPKGHPLKPLEMGMEKTPEEYIARMVVVFREVKRVLRGDGTLWVNIGDSYAGAGYSNHNGTGGCQREDGGKQHHTRPGSSRTDGIVKLESPRTRDGLGLVQGCKPKDLVGIPWMLAFALRADGWYLRSDIIWSKPNPMPESVTDRPTKAHEYVFLLSKSQRYFYDAEAIKEQSSENTHPRLPGNVNPPKGQSAYENGDGLQRTKAGLLAYANRKRAEAGSGIKNNDSFDAAMAVMPSSRNRRTVWTIATAPYSEAHFATFPPDLIKPCILAGTSARGCCPKCGAGWVRILERQESAGKKDYNGKHSQSDPSSAGRNILASVNAARKAGGAHDNPFPGKKTTGWAPACECGCADVVPATVLDPFGGSGTTGKVALELGRSAVLIDLNPEYLTMIESRTNVTPGLAL